MPEIYPKDEKWIILQDGQALVKAPIPLERHELDQQKHSSEADYQYLLLIPGMGLVTYIPRWFPLFLLSQRRLLPWFVDWLDLIPVAIPTFLFALKTRSLGGTVILGMALFWLATTYNP